MTCLHFFIIFSLLNNMSKNDDKRKEESHLVGDLDCPIIPQGPYPVKTEGTLNYFNCSPQGTISPSGNNLTFSSEEKSCNGEEEETYERGIDIIHHCEQVTGQTRRHGTKHLGRYVKYSHCICPINAGEKEYWMSWSVSVLPICESTQWKPSECFL